MAKLTDREINPETARKWWLALMENVASLVDDAVLLLERGTPGRGKSLAILGAEELGKAVWVYSAAQSAWTAGRGSVLISAEMQQAARAHPEKLLSSEEFSDDLPHFWSNYEPIDVRGNHPTTGDFTKQLNLDKQAGFYVDHDADEIRTPSSLSAEGVMTYITRLAQAAEMLLIQDHTRQQMNPGETFESAQHLHAALLFHAHPEMLEWFEGDSE